MSIMQDILPFDTPLDEVRERVLRQRRWFAALGIRNEEVLEILLNPNRHSMRRVERRTHKEIVFYVPSGVLSSIQELVGAFLGRALWFRESQCDLATAFFRGDSIVVNAKFHRHNRSSLMLDLANAYEQIRTRDIFRMLIRELNRSVHRSSYKAGRFYLASGGGWDYKRMERTLEDRAWLISRLLTYQGRLRRGPSTSPFLFNLAMERFDQQVAKAIDAPQRLFSLFFKESERGGRWRRSRGKRTTQWADAFLRHRMTGARSDKSERDDYYWFWLLGLGMAKKVRRQITSWPIFDSKHSPVVYTRYGDNLCLSSSEGEFPLRIEQAVREVVASHNLELNHKKTVRGRNGILVFPGVVIVNGRIRPNNNYVRRVLESPPVTEEEWLGHRGHIGQFGRGGRLHCLKFLHD